MDRDQVQTGTLWLTSTHSQSGGKHTEMMLRFCDLDIHTTDNW